MASSVVVGLFRPLVDVFCEDMRFDPYVPSWPCGMIVRPLPSSGCASIVPFMAGGSLVAVPPCVSQYGIGRYLLSQGVSYLKNRTCRVGSKAFKNTYFKVFMFYRVKADLIGENNRC